MLVAPRTVGAERNDAVPLLADRERDRDVQIPVEAVALVEAADLEKDLAPRRCAVALHRIRVAVRNLVKVFEVVRTKPPWAGQAHGVIDERALERDEEIARQLHRAIELEEEPAASPAEERVARAARCSSKDASTSRGARACSLATAARSRPRTLSASRKTARRARSEMSGSTEQR